MTMRHLARLKFKYDLSHSKSAQASSDILIITQKGNESDLDTATLCKNIHNNLWVSFKQFLVFLILFLCALPFYRKHDMRISHLTFDYLKRLYINTVLNWLGCIPCNCITFRYCLFFRLAFVHRLSKRLLTKLTTNWSEGKFLW